MANAHDEKVEIKVIETLPRSQTESTHSDGWRTHRKNVKPWGIIRVCLHVYSRISHFCDFIQVARSPRLGPVGPTRTGCVAWCLASEAESLSLARTRAQSLSNGAQ